MSTGEWDGVVADVPGGEGEEKDGQTEGYAICLSAGVFSATRV